MRGASFDAFGTAAAAAAVDDEWMGKTALHCAAQRGTGDTAARLLELGANVQLADRGGWYALHHAANGGFTEMVELLIRNGARINAMDRTGQQPLHLAARFGHAAVAQRLLLYGARAAAVDRHGRTPLHMSSTGAGDDLALLLILHGANPWQKDRHGCTAIESFLVAEPDEPDGAGGDDAQTNLITRYFTAVGLEQPAPEQSLLVHRRRRRRALCDTVTSPCPSLARALAARFTVRSIRDPWLGRVYRPFLCALLCGLRRLERGTGQHVPLEMVLTILGWLDGRNFLPRATLVACGALQC